MNLNSNYLRLQQFEADFRKYLAVSNPSNDLTALLSYNLFGGKMMRAQLLMWVFLQCSEESEMSYSRDVSYAAMALEAVHAYSLVHDDLSCMDDDDFRRAKPTTHRLVGEGKAVLVGDALLSLSFELLAQVGSKALPQLLRELSVASGARGMVLGQWMDLSHQQSSLQSLQDMKTLHSLKTGALFAAAATMAGHLSPRCSEEKIDRLREWGQELGVLFQWVDDLLDEEIPSFCSSKRDLQKLCQDQADHLRQLASGIFQSAAHEKLLNMFLSRKV